MQQTLRVCRPWFFCTTSANWRLLFKLRGGLVTYGGARHGWQGKALDQWAAITRMLALLTPTGERAPGKGLQDASVGLGAVLCGQGGRPLLSEARLARLLAARSDQRVLALERAVRMLARYHPRFNLPDLAWAVLNPDGGARIAQDYYRRLDWAASPEKEPSDG